MKFGVMSDIHGNLAALQSVLDGFANEKVDAVLCLGDMIGIGANPDECVSLIKSLQNRVVVSGNHEQYFTQGVEDSGLDWGEAQHQKWQHSRLCGVNKLFLLGLPNERQFTNGGVNVHLSHYAQNKDGTFMSPQQEFGFEQMSQIFGAQKGVYLFGHDHQPNIAQNSQGDTAYICVGSVGCPHKQGVAHAGVLSIADGTFDYRPLTFLYDVPAQVNHIRQLAYPEYEMICSVFY